MSFFFINFKIFQNNNKASFNKLKKIKESKKKKHLFPKFINSIFLKLFIIFVIIDFLLAKLK